MGRSTFDITRREALAGLGGLVGGLLLPASAAARVRPAAPVVKRIRARAQMEGQGAVVQRVFPSADLAHLDPFVLLDDFDVVEPAGFPTHPHRGFEAFTYMLDGSFHHKDNLGNDSLIYSGGIQRFCSGRGAFHSEMPGPGRDNRGLQLWVNLPRRLKQMTPEYQGLDGKRLPLDEGHGQRVREIVGYRSAADLKTEVQYLDVTLEPGRVFARDIAAGWNTLVYVVSGSVEAAGQTLSRGDGVVLGEGALAVRASGASRFVFLSGVPHHEPILLRGPFVD